MTKQTTPDDAQLPEERRLDVSHRMGGIVVPLVLAFLVAGTIVVGVAGTGAGGAVPADDGSAGQQASEVVEYSSTEFRVTVPEDASYYVVLTVEDESPGQTYRIVGGPFVGPLHERMDDPGTSIRKVGVLFE